MLLDKDKIVGLVKNIIDVRNMCRQAIAATDQIVTILAVPASEGNPGKPEQKKVTGQLPNANQFLFASANALLGHLRNIGGTPDDIAPLEKLLNAPLAPVPAKAPATASQAQATSPSAAAK
ncbi:MAG TPA: hypothetical protein VGY56_10715 [Verrucomicrobiae bacterium]|nr:hypothetical protein [Verrucomicrobiae bacterium]